MYYLPVFVKITTLIHINFHLQVCREAEEAVEAKEKSSSDPPQTEIKESSPAKRAPVQRTPTPEPEPPTPNHNATDDDTLLENRLDNKVRELERKEREEEARREAERNEGLSVKREAEKKNRDERNGEDEGLNVRREVDRKNKEDDVRRKEKQESRRERDEARKGREERKERQRSREEGKETEREEVRIMKKAPSRTELNDIRPTTVSLGLVFFIIAH